MSNTLISSLSSYWFLQANVWYLSDEVYSYVIIINTVNTYLTPHIALMRYSCLELLEDILPPLLLASDGETRLECFIEPSEETFDDCLGEYLINDNWELEWCPALSSDGREGSLHRDDESELGPVPSLSPDVRAVEDFLDTELEKNVSSTNLLMSSSPSAHLMVSCPESLESESCDSGIEVCSGEEFDWSRLIAPTDIGIDQFTCLFLVSKESDCKLEFSHVNLYDSMKSNLTR